jgi:hypothetical protein
MLRMQVPDFQLAYRKQGDTLHFQVSGNFDSQEIRIAYWQEIASIIKQEGFRKILVLDRKKLVPASQQEMAQLADLMKIHSDIVDWVAIVEPTPEFVSAAEHAEIEGRAVGFNVRVFSRKEDAERWLMYGLSDQA